MRDTGRVAQPSTEGSKPSILKCICFKVYSFHSFHARSNFTVIQTPDLSELDFELTTLAISQLIHYYYGLRSPVSHLACQSINCLFQNLIVLLVTFVS